MHRGFLDEAGLLDEARQRPHRVGATAEAKEEDVIAGKIVVDQELIGLLDIPGDAPTARAAEEAIDDVVGADAGYVLDDLTFLGRWLKDDRRQSFKTFVARFFLGLLISGAFQVPSQQTISRFFMILLALGRSLVVSGSLRQGISLWHRGSWLLGWCPSLADYGTGMEPTAGDHRRTGARVG